jgi:hypothetical protein
MISDADNRDLVRRSSPELCCRSQAGRPKVGHHRIHPGEVTYEQRRGRAQRGSDDHWTTPAL